MFLALIFGVGGGGGGASCMDLGAAAGAGGGAGGMVYATGIPLPFQGTNPVTAGDGEGGTIAPPAYSVTGTNGGDTTITLGDSLTLTGKGGGGGAMYNVNGVDGGSGGGAAYNGASPAVTPNGGGAGGTTQHAGGVNPTLFQPYCFGTAGGDGHPSPNVYNGAGGGRQVVLVVRSLPVFPLMVVEVPSPSVTTVFVSPLFPGMNATFLTAIGTNGGSGASGGTRRRWICTYDPNNGSASGYFRFSIGGGGGGPRNDISPYTEKVMVLITLDLVGEWEMVETELLFSNTLSAYN